MDDTPRTDPPGEVEDPLLGIEEAAAVVGTSPDGITALVDGEVLFPEPGTEPPRFRASAVRAAREMGG